MSLLDNANIEINNTENNVEAVVENVDNSVDNSTETQDWLSEYKNGLGEEWNDKYENLIKKFTKDGKLDTIELVKAHRNLEKSYSEKRQAPENYEIKYDEGLEDFKVEETDALYQNFISKSKELNLTNDQASGLMNMIASYLKTTSTEMAELEKVQQEETAKRDAEIIKTIDNYEERKNKIATFLSNKLSKEEFDGIKGVVKTPSAFAAIEKLMKLDRDPVIPSKPSGGFNSDNFEEVIEKLLKERDNAHPQDQAKIQKQINELYKRKYGD